MRRFAVLALLLFPSFLIAQTTSAFAPQTARQALIEMFFGTAPNHLEKHLPDTTRNVFKKMSGPNGMSAIDEVSMFATMARAGGGKFETFDTGPVLVQIDDPRENEKVEITVEGDNLSGDGDQIEVALHVTKDEKEQVLPFVPRFMFTMKTEADVWRLSEISVTLRVPLEDPDFLKTIEQEHTKQAEQTAQLNVRAIISAQTAYHSTHSAYACSLAELGKAKRDSNLGGKSMSFPLLNADLAGGKSGGYIFVISGCDGNDFKVVGEPDTPDSGEKAFCSDEGGTIKFSTDGKATTCLGGKDVQGARVGEIIKVTPAPMQIIGGRIPDQQTIVVQGQSGTTNPPRVAPQRVRVSQGVTQGMILYRVQPTYPAEARTQHIQGQVVMAAVIGRDGTIEKLSVLSGDPLLAQTALDAVRQWRYRPYVLNGNPVEVDTQITVNFTLAD
jgi:TonB family protein